MFNERTYGEYFIGIQPHVAKILHGIVIVKSRYAGGVIGTFWWFIVTNGIWSTSLLGLVQSFVVGESGKCHLHLHPYPPFGDGKGISEASFEEAKPKSSNVGKRVVPTCPFRSWEHATMLLKELVAPKCLPGVPADFPYQWLHLVSERHSQWVYTE